MRKKKGFTLIELLAVILILAILALIVSPIVMGVVESANKESAARSLEGYAEAVNTAIAQYALNNKGKMPKELSQVEEYIEAKNKENVIVRESTITKGSISKIKATIGDYICNYNIGKGSSCIELEEYMSSLNLITRRGGESEIVKEIGASLECVYALGAAQICSPEERTAFFDYMQTKYNVPTNCIDGSGTCSDSQDVYSSLMIFISDLQTDFQDNVYSFFGASATKIQSVIFTDQQPSTGESTDISEKQNGKILLYLIPDGENINAIIYSDEKIVFPSDSNSFFAELPILTELKFNDMIDTSNVENMSSFFKNCSNLVELNLDNFNTNSVVNMSGMFYGCSNLKRLNLSNFDTNNVIDMSSMFNRCSVLKNLDISKFNTSKVIDVHLMFYDCDSLETLDVSHFDTSNVIDMSSFFMNCSNLVYINIGNLNTSNVKKMYFMFCGCKSLASLDLSNLDTSNVTDMSDMFSGCSSLETLDLSNFDTSNVTNMGGMFEECTGLKVLNISNWDTHNVVSTSMMFRSLGTMILEEIIGIEDLDMSSNKSMYDMFRCCKKLTSLDLHKWNVSQTVSMNRMFNQCVELRYLNISGWDVSSVTDVEYMFNNCNKLTGTLELNFNWSQITSSVDRFCGGLATAADSNLTINYSEGMENIIDTILTKTKGHVTKGIKV